MREYPKIHTIYKRSPENRTLLEGQFSLPEFEYLANNIWTFTEKVDGTNIRVCYKGTCGHFVTFGGKTDNAQIPAKLANNLMNTFTQNLMESVFHDMDVILYGEGYGAGIQSGLGYRKEQSFVLFDVLVYSPDPIWLKRGDVEDVAEKLGYIEVVPVVEYGSLWSAIELANKGFKSKWGNFTAEGLVAKPNIELKDRLGNRIMAKIKHRDFKMNR